MHTFLRVCLYLHVCASIRVCGRCLYYIMHLRLLFLLNNMSINYCAMVHLGMFLLWGESVSGFGLLFKHSHTHTQNKVHCYAVVSQSSDWLNFHLYSYFPRTPELIWDTMAKLMFRFKVVLIPQKQNKNAWPSVLFDWGVADSVHTK